MNYDFLHLCIYNSRYSDIIDLIYWKCFTYTLGHYAQYKVHKLLKANASSRNAFSSLSIGYIDVNSSGLENFASVISCGCQQPRLILAQTVTQVEYRAFLGSRHAERFRSFALRSQWCQHEGRRVEAIRRSVPFLMHNCKNITK